MDNAGAFKFAIFVLVILGISVFKSCTEVRYALYGDAIEATNSDSREVIRRGRRGREYVKQLVSYQYDDFGTPRKGAEEMSVDYTVPRPLVVQFIPNTEDLASRGTRSGGG